MKGNIGTFIPTRSPEDDIAALFTPAEMLHASEILCRALATVHHASAPRTLPSA